MQQLLKLTEYFTKLKKGGCFMSDEKMTFTDYVFGKNFSQDQKEINLANTIAARLSGMRKQGDIVLCDESEIVMRDCIKQIREFFPKNAQAIKFAKGLENDLTNHRNDFGALSEEAAKKFGESLRKQYPNLFIEEAPSSRSSFTR